MFGNKWKTFLFLEYAPGSGEWQISTKALCSSHCIVPFRKWLFLVRRFLLTVNLTTAHTERFVLFSPKCGLQNNRSSWKVCQNVVISMPSHVSWMWSHIGKWNSSELRVPDEWLRTTASDSWRRLVFILMSHRGKPTITCLLQVNITVSNYKSRQSSYYGFKCMQIRWSIVSFFFLLFLFLFLNKIATISTQRPKTCNQWQ